MNTPVTVRSGELKDLHPITEIYNEAIRTTTATFDTEPRSDADQFAWFNAHGGRHPILVAETEGKVVGWASISQWSERKAYDGAGEISYYFKSEYRGRGVGRKLADAITDEARRLKYHTLIARVAGESEVSLHLCRNAGFVDIGIMKEVGRKFGRLLDVYILQKML